MKMPTYFLREIVSPPVPPSPPPAPVPLLPKHLLEFSEHDPAGSRASLWLELTETPGLEQEQLRRSQLQALAGQDLARWSNQNQLAQSAQLGSLSQFLR